MRPIRENICAVVVTYHPDDNLSDRIGRVVSQVDRLLVVDNGSNRAAVDMLHRIASEKNAELILNGENLGIATALNQGAEWALAKGYTWLLTLDQDSLVDEDMVTHLQQVYDQLDSKDRTGVVAANFRSKYGKYWRKLEAQGNRYVARQTVITSGSLLSLSAFSATGRFRDDLFIDMVDTEYSLRMVGHGYRLYMTTRPLMTHAIGAQTAHSLLGITVIASNHSALRRYYIARNRLVLAKFYLRREPSAVVQEFKNMLIEAVTIVLFEQDRKKKVAAILIGFWDALSGRMGRKTGL